MRATPSTSTVTALATAPLDQRWAAIIKRAMDVTLALPLLMVALPMIALAAMWIVAVDGRPVFYTQVRLGRDGRPLRLWKLRTMVRDAEQVLVHRLMEDAHLRAEWRATCKLDNDPRILPGVGSLLRRFAIDELPQLWNVLRGDLSLVGPRPLPVYHHDKLRAGVQTLRRRVRPGLTGLWQVYRRDHSLAEMERLDTAYVHTWTPFLDLVLLARTVAVLGSGRHCR